LQQGNAEVRDFKAQLLGGSMDGSFKMRDVAGAQVAELHATLHNIALVSIQVLASAQAAREVQLTGTANGTLSAGWRKTFDTLVAHTNADLRGTVAPRNSVEGNPASTSVPIEGKIQADYSASAQTVSFTRSFIQTAETSVNLNGTVSKTASLQVEAQSNDLREIESIGRAFGAMPEPLGLAGTATFKGTVNGSVADPQIEGQFSAAALKVKGTEWRTVRTNIEANPSHIALLHADVVPANNRGRIAFSVEAGLDHWAFKDTNPIQANLGASQMDLSDLKALTGLQTPITGTLNLNVSLRGSVANPVGQGTITLTQATVFDEPIQSANLDVEGTGDELRARLGLRMPAGNAQTSVTYFPKRKAYDGQLQATGIRLEQFRTLQARNVNLTGTLNLNAKVSGTLDDPALQLTAQIPQLTLENQTLSGMTLQAEIANHVATVALESQAQALNVNTFVRGRGRMNLTGAYETEAVIDTSPISLQPLIAAYLPTQAADLTGQTELHATVKGPLKEEALLEAHLTIPTLQLKYKNTFELAAAQPVQLDYTKGVLTLQKTAIRGTKTDLQLQGTIPVTSNAPISVVALGTIDLSIAQMLNPDITSSGQLQLNIDGRGRSNPNVQGQIKIVNAVLAGDSLPVGLQDGNGVLTLTSNRLEITSFQGKISGGTVTATGGLNYRPSLQFNVAVTANGIRTLFPQGVREGIDASLTLVGSGESAVVRGQVRLTEVSFSPTFDFSDIAGVAGSPTGATAPPGSFARKLNLDINVLSAEELNLASGKLSLQGAANMRIRGTAAEPSIIGRVNLTGGDLIFRGNRYFLEPSSIDFVDPYRIEPRMNVAVSTKVKDYDIRMNFRGTMDQLRTTYTSEPALPPADIINLLVFGRTTEDQAANPTPGIMAAKSAVASSVAGQVASGVAKITGISQLSIDPTLGGNQSDPGARVTIQQRVTGNIFVTFATDATSTQRQVIKLEYQVTPRVGVSGVRDQNGGFAFDVRIKNNW
jgi:translocation and assembly module TamB